MLRFNRVFRVLPRDSLPVRVGDVVAHRLSLADLRDREPVSQRLQQPNPNANNASNAQQEPPRGFVTSIDDHTNFAVVSGVNMRRQRAPPSVHDPAPRPVIYEEGVPLNSLVLVHPDYGVPVDVALVRVTRRQADGRVYTELARQVLGIYDSTLTQVDRSSRLVGSYIPLPAPEDNNIPPMVVGRGVTLPEAATSVTFHPNVLEDPFPVALMNEMDRMRRKGRENAALS